MPEDDELVVCRMEAETGNLCVLQRKATLAVTHGSRPSDDLFRNGLLRQEIVGGLQNAHGLIAIASGVDREHRTNGT